MIILVRILIAIIIVTVKKKVKTNAKISKNGNNIT